MSDILIFLCAGTLAAATPLVLAAMGELITEKAGVLNLSIEGMMALGAAAAFVYVKDGGSIAGGFLVGGVFGILLSSVFAVLAIYFLANQVIAGLAVGILGVGLSALIGKRYESLMIQGLEKLDIPFLRDIPFLGKTLFNQDVVVYLSIALVMLVVLFLKYTKMGLIIRAIGESPSSAHAIGYPVRFYRFLAVLFGGLMSGLAGAYISIAYTPLWADGLVAGRGWIVVALVVFGSWRAGRVAIGAYLFGAVSLTELAAQGFGFDVPSQLFSAAPYLVTIFILAVISKDSSRNKLSAPISLGAQFNNPG
ncbi:ABC transporter permease [Dasania marina]|uniref:ABC transporter permease n=1 Tax=Dasania marina TaxID=471499 RepID=UPI0030D91036|tara:strand:- start:42775 stop:43698 length:924 start_codon:yes stop_codon:yes gene_type:complete